MNYSESEITGLIKFDAAKQAIEVASSIDEVKDNGTFKSNRATENFVAAIGLDNKTVYLADEDGFLDGKIINKDIIEIVYRHVTPAESVVCSGYTLERNSIPPTIINLTISSSPYLHS